jgi:hypothetical protein
MYRCAVENECVRVEVEEYVKAMKEDDEDEDDEE